MEGQDRFPAGRSGRGGEGARCLLGGTAPSDAILCIPPIPVDDPPGSTAGRRLPAGALGA